MARKLKIMENEKHPLDGFKNDDITERSEKREMHTVGLEYARKLKITENEIYTL